jgi:hypothetical protein
MILKTCVILGHLASEHTTDNYPLVQLCDECFGADAEQVEGALVISSSKYNPDYGDSCEFCDKTYEDERLENQFKA